jgi:membrane fusion protein (multidrug efflux system)
MRWSGQLAVVAVLGVAGFGGWQAYRVGLLARVPGVATYFPVAGTAAPAPVAPPPLVDVDVVKTGLIVETRDAVGTVRALESITVTAKSAGMVERITFEEGERATRGQELLRLDADERRADLAQAAAEIRRAIAQRDETRVRLDRAVALRRTGAGTEAQVADLTAQLATLDSAIASAEARRKAAEARLDDVVVRAPFAGRLGSRSVSLGAYIVPGTRITTLDDLSRVRLDFSVPENLLGSLQPGRMVRAVSAAFGARMFEGKVTLVDPRVDAVTRAAKLTAEFPNADEALKPGMFLAIVLEVVRRDKAVIVPEEAIVGEGLRHLLFVVKDDTVERRVVRIGQRQNATVEIVEGVQPGEIIVVRGVQRIRPGMKVAPRPIGGSSLSSGDASPSTTRSERRT